MSSGFWAVLGSIAGLIGMLFFGKGLEKMRTAEKKAQDADLKAEKAKVEQRNAEAKAAAEETKAEIAIKVMKVVGSQGSAVSDTLKKIEEDAQTTGIDNEKDTNMIALEIARRQAQQAVTYIGDHQN